MKDKGRDTAEPRGPATPRIHGMLLCKLELLPGISSPLSLFSLLPLMCVTESSMSRATRNSRLWDGGREDFYREFRLRKGRPPKSKGATRRESILFHFADTRRVTLDKNEDF